MFKIPLSFKLFFVLYFISLVIFPFIFVCLSGIWWLKVLYVAFYGYIFYEILIKGKGLYE